MKKLFFILLLGTFFFYSCDGLKDLLDDVTDEVVDSDGDGNDNDDEDDQGGQAGHDMVYLIDKIVETDGVGYKISFEYSYEYIESFRKYMPVREIFTDEEGSVVVDFEYDGNKIYRYVDGESEPGYTYTLDSRNRVFLMYENDTEKTYSVEYEGDYIKSELCEYGERNIYSMNYEWEYGNLIVSSRHTVIYDEDTNGDGVPNDDDIIDRTDVIRYVRTEYPNNTNLDLNMRFCYSYDSTKTYWPDQRCPVEVAISEDGGITWNYRRIVEHGEGYTGRYNDINNLRYEYPVMMQSSSGQIYVAYSAYRRKNIKFVVIDEHWIRGDKVFTGLDGDENTFRHY